MRVVIARLRHATNSFSPRPTKWQDFLDAGALFGGEALLAFMNTDTAMGAFIRVAQEEGSEISTPIAAEAPAGGTVTAQGFEMLVRPLFESIRRGADLVLLDFQGAMAVEGGVDGEGAILETLKKLDPKLTIVAACEPQANLSDRKVLNCTLLVACGGAPGQPHSAPAERAARLGFQAARGQIKPVMSGGSRPLLPSLARLTGEDEPLKTLQAMCRQAETGGSGVLAASVFGGFPLADLHDTGLSALVIADRDVRPARALRDSLLDLAWSRREDFIYKPGAMAEQLSLAGDLAHGPVVVLDHADSPAAGGTQDNMATLAELMRLGVRDVAVAAICDPDVVQAAARAGKGAALTFNLGGKVAVPALKIPQKPLKLKMRVRNVTDTAWTLAGPVGAGQRMALGLATVLRVSAYGLDVLVTSRRIEPLDAGLFAAVGIEAAQKKLLLIKGGFACRAGFASLARHILPVDGEGCATADPARLQYTHLRRPIFPLETDLV